MDLNALVYWNAALLANFNSMLGNVTKAKQYREKADEIKAAVTAVLWNEKWGTWLDYDIADNKPREYFYPSNLAPLWTYCYNMVSWFIMILTPGPGENFPPNINNIIVNNSKFHNLQ